LPGRSVAEQTDRLPGEHGNADAANQSAHLDEATERGGDEIMPTHGQIIPTITAAITLPGDVS
jgi:hypothetical protein